MIKAPDWFQGDVSRETLEAFEAFEALVIKWSQRINLISKKDLSQVSERHIWDSAPIFPFVADANSWIDLGSGGGFPGIVVAILAKEIRPDLKITLIESDARKCTFLRTAIRELDLNAEVRTDRIERVTDITADVISARALASLDVLLELAVPLSETHTKFLFPKGQSWEEEIVRARRKWSFDLTAHSSHTNTNARLLELMNVRHK
ncbi:MAG: 16S rRNA (guanine(527)-N(7))-methyltransferase RsmG [Paracoccaceae bacterium]